MIREQKGTSCKSWWTTNPFDLKVYSILISIKKHNSLSWCLADVSKYTVPFSAVSITVAVVSGVHAVLLQAAGTLLAARWSPAPVSLHLSCTWTPDPPAERRAVCNTHVHSFFSLIKTLYRLMLQAFPTFNQNCSMPTLKLKANQKLNVVVKYPNRHDIKILCLELNVYSLK